MYMVYMKSKLKTLNLFAVTLILGTEKSDE